jgi:hypothetical protein
MDVRRTLRTGAAAGCPYIRQMRSRQGVFRFAEGLAPPVFPRIGCVSGGISPDTFGDTFRKSVKSITMLRWETVHFRKFSHKTVCKVTYDADNFVECAVDGKREIC